jgi:hypothetical protein
METKKYTPCGGCGATDPIDRCIGCFHPFEKPHRGSDRATIEDIILSAGKHNQEQCSEIADVILRELPEESTELAALQAKCERYEKALKEIAKTASVVGQPSFMWQANEALAGDGEKEVEK